MKGVDLKALRQDVLRIIVDNPGLVRREIVQRLHFKPGSYGVLLLWPYDVSKVFSDLKDLGLIVNTRNISRREWQVGSLARTNEM